MRLYQLFLLILEVESMFFFDDIIPSCRFDAESPAGTLLLFVGAEFVGV